MALTTLTTIGESLDEEELGIVLRAWMRSRGKAAGGVLIVESFGEDGELLAQHEIHP